MAEALNSSWQGVGPFAHMSGSSLQQSKSSNVYELQDQSRNACILIVTGNLQYLMP